MGMDGNDCASRVWKGENGLIMRSGASNGRFHCEVFLMLRRFSTRELIVIAILAAMGVAVKPLVGPLIKTVSRSLMLPGGSLGGGFYMMWLTLAVTLVPRSGSGVLTGLVQAMAVFVLGWYGNHGAFTLVSYPLPGLVADLCGFPFRKYLDCHFSHILICIGANITGTMLSGYVMMRLEWRPLLYAAGISILSAVIGGLLSWSIYRQIKTLRLI